MARSDDDKWDLASGVGATATMVAAGRAMATKDPRHLIDDPFAEPLVRAVGIEFFITMLDGGLEAAQWGDTTAEEVSAMIAGMALRTKFFDDYFISACATAGIRQAVILASGLDSRAYRLPWPPQTVLYEIDQPAVIDFTTTWLAEGLLIYLPPDAQDGLLDLITALSALGSTLATEYAPGIIDFDAAKAREMTAAMRLQGLDIDMPELVYPGPRSNVMEYLGLKGWLVTGTPGDDLFLRSNLTPPDRGDHGPLGEIVYISASR